MTGNLGGRLRRLEKRHGPADDLIIVSMVTTDGGGPAEITVIDTAPGGVVRRVTQAEYVASFARWAGDRPVLEEHYELVFDMAPHWATARAAAERQGLGP